MRNENVKYVLNNPGERKEAGEEGGRERPRVLTYFFFFFQESGIRRILIKPLRSRICVTILCISTHHFKGKKGFRIYGYLGFAICVRFLVGFFLGGQEMFCQFVWILGFKVQHN